MNIYSSISGKEFDYDLYGNRSYFRRICEKLTKSAVEKGSWPAFCTKVSDKQTNLMSVKNDEGSTLGSMVASLYPNTLYKYAVYKYLLSDFMCYYECPVFTKNGIGGDARTSFDKFIATSNLYVVSYWMGMDFDEACETYGDWVMDACDDNESEFIGYLKLYKTKDGVPKVTRPRGKLDLSKSGTRIIPVFALNSAMHTLYKMLEKDFYNISYVKDNGSVRVLNTTVNIDNIRDIYGDTNMFRTGVAEMYSDDFLNDVVLDRGYTSMFEVGASKYDDACRKVNISRIIKVEKGTPDLKYINIDLTSVSTHFKNCLDVLPCDILELVDALKEACVGGESLSKFSILNHTDAVAWVEDCENYIGTNFLRELALFMMMYPDWFKDYDGSPCREEVYSSEDTDSNLDNFELDIDI